jgi:hypothetical protein
LIITFVFENFFSYENWQKLEKFVIIASTSWILYPVCLLVQEEVVVARDFGSHDAQAAADVGVADVVDHGVDELESIL